MEVKGEIVQKVQKYDHYEVASSLIDLEEYYIKGERPTRIMSLETDTNTKETNKIGIYMLYKADITGYTKINKESKKKLHKSYTAIWEFCNK